MITDRDTKDPLPEGAIEQIVGRCMLEHAAIIGVTNRSISGLINTLCFSPALISTKNDIDGIIAAIDESIGYIFD